jgi:hypothetical protein
VLVTVCGSLKFNFKLKLIYDRLSVGHSVLVSAPPPSGAPDQIFITVGHLRSSCFGASSLTRERVCNLLVQFAVTLLSKSRRTYDHILLSHLRLPQPGEPGPLIYIPQEQGGPVIPPGTGLYFLSPLTTRRATVEVSLPWVMSSLYNL